MESKSYPIEIFQNFVGQGSLEGCPEDFSLMPLGPTLPVMIVRIATTGLTDSLGGFSSGFRMLGRYTRPRGGLNVPVNPQSF